MRKRDDKRFDRVLDANFNRAKEGLRVCEDICRFVLDEKNLTRGYKHVRHQLTGIFSGPRTLEVIRSRNIEGDVGRGSTSIEFKRVKAMDVFYANSQRVKESIRVLEEFMKLRDRSSAEKLKRLRYRVYGLEKKAIE